jgi:type II secretory pathway pseudopilin PulG
MTPQRLSNAKQNGERGYVLIAILFMVAVIMIVMASAAPGIATSIKRQREDELIRRGKQYQRAIQLYYRKFGRFPASIEQLQNTNNIRFLRRKYPDPITGKDEWRLIRFGQAKPRTPPAYLGAQGQGQGGGGMGMGSGIGTPTPSSNQGALPGTSASSISRPLSGSTSIGGGPIVGVASTSEKESVKEIDGKNHYHEWEFVYDPTLDAGARQQPNDPGRSQRPPRDGGFQPQVPTPNPIRPQ